jgi:predicted nucleic acid-binding protein
MYLFCPLGDYNKYRQKQYSSFLQQIQSLKCGLIINSMVLSEFANRYLRMDFELWKKETKNYSSDFKRDFIGSKRYKETVGEIEIIIKRIDSICDKSTDNFNAININNVLLHFKYIDFNDSYYLELADIVRCKIVTDDKDFVTYTNHNIDIITII